MTHETPVRRSWPFHCPCAVGRGDTRDRTMRRQPLQPSAGEVRREGGFGGIIATFPYASVRLVMPLPVPQRPRDRVHSRRIVVEGYRRDDGFLELDACLEDVKDVDYPLAPGVRRAGDPVHQIRVRVTIDAEFNIVAADACLDRVPYPGGCDTIAPEYRRLVGLNLLRGFRRTVGEMFSDVRGCSHLSELLLSLPTAAIQTFATFQRDNADTGEKPFQLDRCHALETSSETVRRFYPKWYRARGTGEA